MDLSTDDEMLKMEIMEEIFQFLSKILKRILILTAQAPQCII